MLNDTDALSGITPIQAVTYTNSPKPLKIYEVLFGNEVPFKKSCQLVKQTQQNLMQNQSENLKDHDSTKLAEAPTLALSQSWRIAIAAFLLLFVYSLVGLVVPMGTDLPLWSVSGVSECSGSVLQNWNNPDEVRTTVSPGSSKYTVNIFASATSKRCREKSHSQAARLGLVAGLSVVAPLAAWWIRSRPEDETA